MKYFLIVFIDGRWLKQYNIIYPTLNNAFHKKMEDEAFWPAYKFSIVEDNIDLATIPPP